MIGSTTTDAGQPAFVPVGVLNTKCSTSSDIVRANIAHNIKRNLPRLHQCPTYGKYKPEPIAIVAGGPSLNSTIDELRALERVMVCGSAHDRLIELGVTPDWVVLCDASPSELDFIKYSDPLSCYLVASMCDPAVFDYLEGHRVVMWHNFQGDDPACFGDEYPHAIMGGCTVTTRATNIAIMLGYINQHYFGFDSSFIDGKQYAYPGNPDDPKVIPVRVGEREFQTTPGWLAQATHFAEMVRNYGFMFNPTIHGDGLIAAMIQRGEKT